MSGKLNRILPQTHPPNNKNAERTRPVVRSAVNGMLPFMVSLYESFKKPMVNDDHPDYRLMLSAQQRSAVEKQILHRMSNLTGNVEDEARYTVICAVHNRGIYYFDLKAELGIHTLPLHLKVANRICVVDFRDGYKACHMDGHTDCDERYLATSLLRRLSMRFDTETYR